MRVKFYKGNVIVVGCKVVNIFYDDCFFMFEEDGGVYD